MTILSQDFVVQALSSKEAFPIDFDTCWKASGYKRKDHALRAFRKLTSLKVNLHFSPDLGKSIQGGRPGDSFNMTVDAFKFFLAKSNTQAGDDALWYFIEVERTYRNQLEIQFAALSADQQRSTITLDPFPYTPEQLRSASGIRSIYHVRNSIRLNFKADVDYLADEAGKPLAIAKRCH